MTDTSTPQKSASVVLLIFWVAFLQSAILFTALSWFLGPQGDTAPELPLPPAAIAGVVSFGVIAAMVVIGSALKPPGDQGADAFMAAVRTRLIVRCAMAETIAIIGFVFRFAMGLPPVHAVGFGCLAVLAVVALLPGLLRAGEYYKYISEGKPVPAHLRGFART